MKLFDAMPKPTIAAVQAAPIYFDVEAGIRKVETATREAKSNGADLVVFSESFIPGFPTWVHLLAPIDQHELFIKMARSSIEVPSAEFYQLSDIAKDNRTFLSVGITERAPKQSLGVLWNTNLIFNREGELISHHRKLMPNWSEKLMWSFGDGSSINVIDTEIGRIGTLICGENTNPLAKYSLISQGEQIHISTYPACFPTTRDTEAMQDYFDTILVRACSMAYEGKVFTVVSSQALDEKGFEVLSNGSSELRSYLDRLTFGGSMIVAPSGLIISDIIRDNKEGIAYAECDLAKIIAFKNVHDVAGSYQRTDVFQFVIDKTARGSVDVFTDAPEDSGCHFGKSLDHEKTHDQKATQKSRDAEHKRNKTRFGRQARADYLNDEGL